MLTNVVQAACDVVTSIEVWVKRRLCRVRQVACLLGGFPQESHGVPDAGRVVMALLVRPGVAGGLSPKEVTKRNDGHRYECHSDEQSRYCDHDFVFAAQTRPEPLTLFDLGPSLIRVRSNLIPGGRRGGGPGCRGGGCLPFLAVSIHLAGLAARVRVPASRRLCSHFLFLSTEEVRGVRVPWWRGFFTAAGRCGRS
jgi:hypothetical protein